MRIPLLALALAAALLTPPAALPALADSTSGLAIGAEVPDFGLPDENGAEHRLSQYRGKAVVLEWTNQECPYVLRHYERDTMEKLAGSLGAKDVVWLAVNSTASNTPADTLAWRKEQGFEYATLQDPEGTVGRSFGARTTPHMFVIDAEGVLRYSGAIDDDPRGRSSAPAKYVEGAASTLLMGGNPDPSHTEPYGCSVKYKN